MAETIPLDYWEWQKQTGNYNTGSYNTWMLSQSSNTVDMSNFNYTTGSSSGYAAFATTQPANWHTFPCGHQLKLEPGQPVPGICEKCGPVEWLVYTYERCKHALSYQKGTKIPSVCDTCQRELFLKKHAAEKAIEQREAEERRIEEENRDLRVWLDREIQTVLVAA